MSERIRFHLDENVDPDVARALRRQGIDVTTTVEMNLLGQSDEVQFELVLRQKRIIVTHDTDFLRFATQTKEHWGIAFCQKGTRSIGEMIRSLILIHEVFTLEEMKGNKLCLFDLNLKLILSMNIANWRKQQSFAMNMLMEGLYQ